uniref:Uncharacterized protein n=1 Tax=Arundo donax TaxID=35708 RepID=A0A0A8YL99_ARUDO
MKAQLLSNFSLKSCFINLFQGHIWIFRIVIDNI